MVSEVIDYDALPPHLHPQVETTLRAFYRDPASGCLFSALHNMRDDPTSRSERFRLAEAKRAINRKSRATARPT